MGKHTHGDSTVSGQRFFWVTTLNILITVVEFIGGGLSGSLSLVSDAFHNLSDSAAIAFSYVAHRISKKPQDSKSTYGYRRAQIIVAFLNSIVLIMVCVGLVVEAIQRISHPEPINGKMMLIVSIVGLLANVLSAVLLNAGAQKNLNMKATYLHIMSDALSSVAIIIGGILIQLYNWTLVDPAITIIVALYIIYEAAPIIRQTFKILMEEAPADIDYHGMKADLMKLDNVLGVHHIHAWQIDEHNLIVSLHVNLKEDMCISEAETIYREIGEVLADKYEVSHVTIQAEAKRGVHEKMIYDQGKDLP